MLMLFAIYLIMQTASIFRDFIHGMKETGGFEYCAVFTGIASVWFSKKENIWVYPAGLINTIIYVYISLKGSLPGEAAVNFYYTIMNIYGWILWSKKDLSQNKKLHITFSSKNQWMSQVMFFTMLYIIIFFALTYLKNNFAPGAIPWADAFASSTAFTGMWLMTKKKVESWYWWIATNIASIPLYFVKHYVFTSVYYFILLIIAIGGLAEWRKRTISSQLDKKII